MCVFGTEIDVEEVIVAEIEKRREKSISVANEGGGISLCLGGVLEDGVVGASGLEPCALVLVHHNLRLHVCVSIQSVDPVRLVDSRVDLHHQFVAQHRIWIIVLQLRRQNQLFAKYENYEKQIRIDQIQRKKKKKN